MMSDSSEACGTSCAAEVHCSNKEDSLCHQHCQIFDTIIKYLRQAIFLFDFLLFVCVFYLCRYLTFF